MQAQSTINAKIRCLEETPDDSAFFIVVSLVKTGCMLHESDPQCNPPSVAWIPNFTAKFGWVWSKRSKKEKYQLSCISGITVRYKFESTVMLYYFWESHRYYDDIIIAPSSHLNRIEKTAHHHNNMNDSWQRSKQHLSASRMMNEWRMIVAIICNRKHTTNTDEPTYL